MDTETPNPAFGPLAQTREQRQRAVASANAILATQGLQVSPDVAALHQQFIEGTLTTRQMEEITLASIKNRQRQVPAAGVKASVKTSKQAFSQ